MNTNIITLTFVGDFVAALDKDIHVSNEIENILNNSDINICNFEAPINNQYSPIIKSGPNLNQSEKSAFFLEQLGFSIISLANNHIMDYGAEGLFNTMSKFRKAKLVGAGSWEDAYKATVVQIKSKRIAFFSYTQCEFGTLTDKYDQTYNCGTAWINHRLVMDEIKKIRSSVDYIIVLAHAGVENIPLPLPEWRERYKEIIDYGADAIIASHPHIIQGYEYYKDKPIFYSLGNFYFPKKNKMQEYWYKSLILSLHVNIDNNNINHSIRIAEFGNENITLNRELIIEEFNNSLDLNKKQDYIDKINKYCIELLPHYYNTMVLSGFYSFKFKMPYIKTIIKSLLNPKCTNKSHFINNLRCESHRWCIIRALKLLKKIQ